MLSNFRWSLL